MRHSAIETCRSGWRSNMPLNTYWAMCLPAGLNGTCEKCASDCPCSFGGYGVPAASPMCPQITVRVSSGRGPHRLPHGDQTPSAMSFGLSSTARMPWSASRYSSAAHVSGKAACSHGSTISRSGE